MPWRTYCLDDQAYPHLLREIYDPPPRLFVRGVHQELLDTPCIAIVGARKATAYACSMAHSLARDLSLCGFTIVSGMAYGIDAHAHHGALAGSGKTIAVWGSGIDIIYPRGHTKLAERIFASGCAVSEFPLGTPALPHHFPRRNRIISGLAYGVVVVEAALRSGSLITARLALEQGREVFALPGLAGSVQSAGTNRLLKQGAKLVESADEIVEELLPMLTKNSGQSQLLPVKSAPLSSRASPELSPFTLEEFAADEKLTLPAAMETLLALQMGGRVQELPGKRFIYR